MATLPGNPYPAGPAWENVAHGADSGFHGFGESAVWTGFALVAPVHQSDPGWILAVTGS